MKQYLVLVMRLPNFDVALIDAHMRFLAELRSEDRIVLSGGFGDKSGGAYLLRAESLDNATAIAQRDPLQLANSSVVTVHEWNAA